MPISMLEGFESYLKNELILTDATVNAYMRDVKEFLFFANGRELTATLLQEFLCTFIYKQFQQTTIRRKCMSVRCFFHNLISLKQMDKNILQMIDSVQIQRKEPHALSNENVDKLFGAIYNRTPKCRTTNVCRDVAIVTTLYHSGLRVTELCDLDLPDINYARKTIKVFGKGSRERIVPTTQVCLNSLTAYIDKERDSTNAALFVKADGHRMSRRSVSDMILLLSHKAGIPRATSHLLRRSCATSLMDRGVEIELIQQLLGHQDLTTTQTYLAINDNQLMQAHRKFHPFGDKNAV